MTAALTSKLLLAGCLCGLIPACQTPPNDARKALATQLAARRDAQQRSIELYHEGLNAYRTADREHARTCLTHAVTEDDRNAHAWMLLGVVEFERDRLFDAAHAFHRAARLAPTRYEPHFNLGTILESVGRYSQAIEAYEKALKLAPDQLDVMENLARCCVRANQNPPRAKELIDQALLVEHRPEWRQWLERQAERLARTGKAVPP